MFFSNSVLRVLRHGPLAPQDADQQRATLGGRAALLLFVVAVPLIHWAAVFAAGPISPGLALLSSSLIVLAVALNGAAAATLGASYDRLVVPVTLTTRGVYSVVRHPIYLSYNLLFTGFCLAHGAQAAAATALAICTAHFGLRAAAEDRMLLDAFGPAFSRYQSAVPAFLPFGALLLKIAAAGPGVFLAFALVVEGLCALHRGPLAVRYDGRMIGAEARFAEALHRVAARSPSAATPLPPGGGSRSGDSQSFVSSDVVLPPPPSKKGGGDSPAPPLAKKKLVVPPR